MLQQGTDICKGNVCSRILGRNKSMKWLGFRKKNRQEHLDISQHPYKRLQDISRKRIKIPNCTSNPGFYLLVKFMQKESKIMQALSTSFKLFTLRKIASL